MSTDDCVCLHGWDGDPPQLFHERICGRGLPTGVYECHRPIPAGARYHQISGKWEDRMDRFRFCLDCHHIGMGLTCGDGFTFGTLWEDIEADIFPTMRPAAWRKSRRPRQKTIS